MTPFDRIISCVRKLPSLQFGLKWFPNLEPHVNNNEDNPPFGFPEDATEVSDCNQRVFRNAMDSLGQGCQRILEIGVSRNGDRSFTSVIAANKHPSAKYLGVDTDDREWVEDVATNRWFLKCNSHEQDAVRARLVELGMNELDLILIDGWHSVNTTVNDFSYGDMLRVGGMLVIHDTNTHPGPVALFDAVDERVFEKHRYCTAENDMGISTFSRIK
jgi:hypothetical protein